MTSVTECKAEQAKHLLSQSHFRKLQKDFRSTNALYVKLSGIGTALYTGRVMAEALLDSLQPLMQCQIKCCSDLRQAHRCLPSIRAHRELVTNIRCSDYRSE